MTEAERIQALQVPATYPVAAILDTDTYNEVDDQFALIYALLSPKVDLKAVFAAPYFNSRSTGPADGMEKSYREILRIMDILQIASAGFAWRGSTVYMSAKDRPVDSPAARRLIELAHAAPEPLQVLTIGCATNIASALLLDPAIADKIVVVWLGGHTRDWPHTNEFNLMQDVYAAQVLFDSGVPLVRFPCSQVTELLLTTVPELETCLGGKTAVGDYLVETVRGYAPQDERRFAWSKVIWDIITVAWIDCPEALTTVLVPTPRLVGDHATPKNELCFNLDSTRPLCREAVHVRRDRVFGRLFHLINESGR
ncbi:MAG: nucleoside hydrolase [Bacillota bacterium]|nr:nucleoside hydrolase [Bacillota bacterium]